MMDIFALEAKYQAIESEYATLMLGLDPTCGTSDCIRAAQLNADMQTTLSEMSDNLTRVNAPTVKSQQAKLLILVDKLEAEYKTLTKGLSDVQLKTNASHAWYAVWGVAACIAGLCLLKF